MSGAALPPNRAVEADVPQAARASRRTLGPGDVVTEAFDDVIREYIDFVNQQVGAYMDALAGFAGRYARVERQVHRVNRPVKSEIDRTGKQVVVWPATRTRRNQTSFTTA